MIIKLNNTYNEKVIKYLMKDLDFNMFMINDIEKYGYDNNFMEIWGEIERSGEIKGILVRYFQYLTFYSHSRFNINNFAKKINGLNYAELCGRSEILKRMYPKLNLESTKTVKFCSLSKISQEYLESDENFKKIRFGNISKIVKLYREVDEFENTTVDAVKNNLKTGRGYCIEKNRKVVAMAKSTNENATHAMIIGVATHPEYRNQGLATECVAKICRELLAENKKPCLFYENETAGRIYKKMGFEELGQWSVYYPKKNSNVVNLAY